MVRHSHLTTPKRVDTQGLSMAPQRKRQRPDDYFVDWKEREALAESMIPIVGTLAREKNVKCYIYGKSLVNLSVLDIMKAHRWVRQVEDNELSEFEQVDKNIKRALIQTFL